MLNLVSPITKPQLTSVNTYARVLFGKSDEYGNFMEKLNKSGKPIENVIAEGINEKNLLGEGGSAKVYEFPTMPDYVIRVSKKMYPYKVEDPFEGTNMGQPIAGIYKEISILKRQKGSEHSIKNWTHYVTHQNELTTEHATKFLNDVEKISTMPDKTYIKFAESVKLLDEKGYKMDNINPNNLLIDDNNINIVDYFKSNIDYNHKNSYGDMVTSLLDFRLFEKYYNLLDQYQQDRLLVSSQKIAAKSKEAAQSVGLTTDEKPLFDYLSIVDKFSGGEHVKTYENLKKYVNI